MRAYYFYILCILFSTNLAAMHSDCFTHDIQMRYYHIARLQKIIKLTTTDIKNKKNCVHQIIATLKIHQHVFQQPPIVDCINRIILEQKIDPLLQLWHNIQQYKFIHNNAIMHEFVKLIVLIMIPLSAHLITKNSVKAHAQSEIDYPLMINLDPAQFSFRFYIINRLRIPINTLKLCKKKTIRFEKNLFTFKNKTIKTCFHKMIEQQSVAPLISLYAYVEQFRYLESTFFIQEFLTLLILTYETITHQPHNLIDSLHTIPDFLGALDTLTMTCKSKNHTQGTSLTTYIKRYLL